MIISINRLVPLFAKHETLYIPFSKWWTKVKTRDRILAVVQIIYVIQCILDKWSKQVVTRLYIKLKGKFVFEFWKRDSVRVERLILSDFSRIRFVSCRAVLFQRKLTRQNALKFRYRVSLFPFFSPLHTISFETISG